MAHVRPPTDMAPYPLEVFEERSAANAALHGYARSLVRKGLTPRMTVQVRPTRRRCPGGPFGIYLVVRR